MAKQKLTKADVYYCECSLCLNAFAVVGVKVGGVLSLRALRGDLEITTTGASFSLLCPFCDKVFEAEE